MVSEGLESMTAEQRKWLKAHILIHNHETMRERESVGYTGDGWRESLKPQSHPPVTCLLSNSATLSNPFQMAPPTADQVSKPMSLCDYSHSNHHTLSQFHNRGK